MKKNPRLGAGLLSHTVFAWFWPTFWRGARKQLDIGDLNEPLSADLSERVGDRLEQVWLQLCNEAKQKGTAPSLMKALARVFGLKLLAIGLMEAFNTIGLRLLQTLFLGWLLKYFSPGSAMATNDAFYSAGALAMCTLCSLITTNHCIHRLCHLGMQVRVACCSLIFRKATRLSRSALGETASGQMVNLLSNDVSRFDNVTFYLNHLWIAPVFSTIVACLLYGHVGWAGLVGIGIVFMVVVLQAYNGRLTVAFRHKIAVKTDSRLRLMDEIVNGILVIKMYAWEKLFMRGVSDARREEMREVLRMNLVRGVFMTFKMFTTRVALFATLVTYALSGHPLEASFVFVIQSYYSMLSASVGTSFIRGMTETAECAVAISRLQNFMEYEEHATQTPSARTKKNSESARSLGNPTLTEDGKQDCGAHPLAATVPRDDALLQFTRTCAKWDPQEPEDTLKDVDLTVGRGELVAVIGPVGSGKSSLLEAVLGELPTSGGALDVRGSVSYAGQEPWLVAASVRHNITFGSAFEPRRYQRVLRACALHDDLARLPLGDMTPVGERGSRLSGGQRARVNLARAVYRDADIYLLDDPLSAVDAHVGKHLFQECVLKFLAGKTRILVTHQVQYLGEVSRIAVLDDGEIKMQGTMQELLDSNVDFVQFLLMPGVIDGVDDGMKSKRRLTLRQVSRTSSIRDDWSDIGDDEADEESAAGADGIEASTKGKVKGSLLARYVCSGTNVLGALGVVLLFAAAQSAGSAADYFVGFWTRQEEMRAHLLRAGEDAGSPLLRTDGFVFVYTGIILSLLTLGLARVCVYYWVCGRGAQALHDLMFTNLMRTTMTFFNVNPSGRILNRFSKDLGTIDELVPKSILNAGQFLLDILGSVVVTVAINWIFLIPIVGLMSFFFALRVIYLRSARNIKRLEGMTRSPVFTHLNATMQGLSTIRAFGAEGLVTAEFDNHQNLHSAACSMFISATCSFGTILDLLSLSFTLFVVFSFLLVEKAADGADVGLAITQTMAMTAWVQYAVRQTAEAATNLLSVERVLDYAQLPAEDDTKGTMPHDEWPTAGLLELRSVSVRYDPNPPVINDLNLTIRPMEKVGIVGRTGAGKSSLVSALFRLSNVEGLILLDGVDTAYVPLQHLRSRISIIPQNPVLFSGTLRSNLDPFDEYADHQLWAALQSVELRDVQTLETRVADAGANISVGQRQLICLARAVLRGNKILVLDEATANVDPQTDALIQKTIRSNFRHCTVLTVAHRLHTIVDSDRVLVMDGGRAAEFDHPHVLIENRGLFHSLVQESGRGMAEHLKRIAKDNYDRRTS